MNHYHEEILNQMGITSWQARVPLSGAKIQLQYKCYRLNREQAYLILEDAHCCDPDGNLLLNNMLASVQLQIVEEENDPLVTTGANCLVMSMNNALVEVFVPLAAKLTTVIHSTQLLQGADKRTAWLQLLSFENSSA